MNESMHEHIQAALRQGVRFDGRDCSAWRDLSIETGVTKSAEGSARVRCGKTDIIVGVKLSVGTPFPDSPNKGVLMVGAELRPLAHPSFEAGPPSYEAIEVARVIDRGIRESGMINEESLCITPGEKVWIVNVDICPLNHDGNLIDLGTLGALAALKETRLPGLTDDGQVDYEKRTDTKLELLEEPIAVTVLKIGSTFLIDPTFEEERVLDARLTVTSLSNGKICALQKGGSGTLSLDDVKKMVALAQKKSGELRKQLASVER